MTTETRQPDITTRQIETEDDFDAIRGLVREFFDLAADLDPGAADATPFIGMEQELADLPGKYAPPGGAFLLVRMDGAPVGCGAFFDHGSGTVEVRRMYVREEARRLSLGRRIVQGLIDEARAQSQTKIVLSTFYKLEAAQALYARMGFQRCAPTEAPPPGYEDKLIFMEMTL